MNIFFIIENFNIFDFFKFLILLFEKKGPTITVIFKFLKFCTNKLANLKLALFKSLPPKVIRIFLFFFGIFLKSFLIFCQI